MREDLSNPTAATPPGEDPGFLQRLLGEIPEAILVVSGEGRVLFWSAKAERTYGFRADEACGRMLEALVVPEEEREHLRQHLRQASAGDGPSLGWRQTRSGARLFVESTFRSFPGPGGQRQVVLICDRDASDLLQLNENQPTEAMSRFLLEACPDAMAVVREDGTIALANSQLLCLFGYERGELLNQPVEVLVPEPLRRAHAAHRRDYRREPRIRPMGNNQELHGRRKDGTVFPVEISLSPLRTASGLLVIAAARDLTERRQVEERLCRERVARLQAEAAEKQAAQAVQQRDEFLSLVSHELKTPLTSLRLVTQALSRMSRSQENPCPSWASSKLETLYRQVDRLARLIDELLDISLITTGHLELASEALDLGELAQEVVSSFQDTFREARLSLTVQAGGSLSGWWDRLRLEQVLINLLDNALKYGGSQPVQVEVADMGDCVRLSVRDLGVGIAHANHDRIFERFERAAPGPPSGGIGLGLWISREIVNAHGGTIRVESEPNHGALFVVELPHLRPPGERASGQAANPPA